MKRACALLLLAALTWGCGTDPEAGRRFRAEREYWNASNEVQRLQIRPDLVDKETWTRLAARFEAIPDEHQSRHDTPAGRDIRVLAARALVSAARIHGALGDSAKMSDDYARVERDYGDLPLVAGEVALAQGRIAESRGNNAGAVDAYGRALALVQPRSGDSGVAGAVMDLPLRMARLRATSLGDSSREARAPLYAEAVATYRRWASDSDDSMTRLDARSFLGDAAADLGDWRTASREFRAVETALAQADPPSKDPGAACYARGSAMQRGGAPEDSVRAAYERVVQTYEDSPFVPPALFQLAGMAYARGRTEESLGYLDQIRNKFNASEQLASTALYLRAQVLEHAGRWGEALEVYRSLPVEHPVTEPALLAPLEIASHYAAAGDSAASLAALQRAEQNYRDFLRRYPSGPESISAHEKLVRTLSLEKRYNDALTELLKLADSQRGQPRAASYLVAAYNLATKSLADTTRGAEILEQTATLYPNQAVGAWAAKERAKLRAEATP